MPQTTLADLLGDIAPAGAEGTVVTGITADSRAVAPGMLFAALPGTRVDGALFVADAVAAGAVAVLARRGALGGDPGVPVAETDDPRRALALAAARLYPDQPERIAAVTGTAGKTSVVEFVRQLAAGAGRRAASLGTLGLVGGAEETGNLTTPDPVALHARLAALAAEGVTDLAMEASSHGIDQRRLDGVRLAAVGFTNIGRDHLDYHGTPEAYLAAKLRLFDTLAPAEATLVVEPGAPGADAVLAVAARRGLATITVGPAGETLRLVRATPEPAGQRLALAVEGETRAVALPLPGAFQVSNALVAAGLARALGLSWEAVLDGLERLKGAPGRLELVARRGNGAPVFVDYAHKPEALEAVLSTLRLGVTGKLVVVFGAGGDRDRGKRPLMGAVAARLADHVIVTDDNPRTEDPAAIRAEIIAGAGEVLEIPDRATAIEEAISILGPDDALVVAGKGHETGQIVGETTFPFSDQETIRLAIEGENEA